MSTLKAGTQGFLKVTQEPVFVLEIRDGNATQRYPGLSGKVAMVRRPTAGDNGVRHEIEFFTVEEIESVEDSQKRTISEMQEFKARMQSGEITESTSPESQLSKLD